VASLPTTASAEGHPAGWPQGLLNGPGLNSRDQEREEHQMNQHASGLVDDLDQGGYHDGGN